MIAAASIRETPMPNLAGRIPELDGLRGILVGMGMGFASRNLPSLARSRRAVLISAPRVENCWRAA